MKRFNITNLSEGPYNEMYRTAWLLTLEPGSAGCRLWPSICYLQLVFCFRVFRKGGRLIMISTGLPNFPALHSDNPTDTVVIFMLNKNI